MQMIVLAPSPSEINKGVNFQNFTCPKEATAIFKDDLCLWTSPSTSFKTLAMRQLWKQTEGMMHLAQEVTVGSQCSEIPFR